MNRCWICDAPATTGEHKIKRSDLERVHGRGTEFRAANLNYLLSDGRIVQLQGPDSRHLKFPEVLCDTGNNARTQPFDLAYDEFARFIDSETVQLTSRRQIDFRALFGDHWRERQADLFKYFVKAFGCRIAAARGQVPDDLRRALYDGCPTHPFAICFAVDEDELAKPTLARDRLGIGHLFHI